MQSSVFHRILADASPPTAPSHCLAGCGPKPTHKESSHGEECKDPDSLPPVPAEQSGWLSTWTKDQIKRYTQWYTRRGGDNYPQDTAKPAAKPGTPLTYELWNLIILHHTLTGHSLSFCSPSSGHGGAGCPAGAPRGELPADRRHEPQQPGPPRLAAAHGQ
jgi:hypothetical protein